MIMTEEAGTDPNWIRSLEAGYAGCYTISQVIAVFFSFKKVVFIIKRLKLYNKLNFFTLTMDIKYVDIVTDSHIP